MYTKGEIEQLKVNKTFLLSEEDRYCLVNLYQGHRLTSDDVKNQANFCILEAVNAYHERKITSDQLNTIIDKVELFVYAEDMLGYRRAIDKLNHEIIEEELHIPHFNALCVTCEDLYDTF